MEQKQRHYLIGAIPCGNYLIIVCARGVISIKTNRVRLRCRQTHIHVLATEPRKRRPISELMLDIITIRADLPQGGRQADRITWPAAGRRRQKPSRRSASPCPSVRPPRFRRQQSPPIFNRTEKFRITTNVYVALYRDVI